MSDYKTWFRNLTFNKIKQFSGGKVIEPKVEKGEAYVGVVNITDIKWTKWSDGDSFVDGATVNLYLQNCKETNVIGKAKKDEITDHRVLMEANSFWQRFEMQLARACDEEGNRRPNYDVSVEPELFYGFTRKKDIWYSTSCTLNSWIKPMTDKDSSHIVKFAGKRGADKLKYNLINLMPNNLWTKILPHLQECTDYDGQAWTLDWAISAHKKAGDNAEDIHGIKQMEVALMRRLVFLSAEGSKLYDLDLYGKKIGEGGNSSVQALVTVLQEQEKYRGEKINCSLHLRILDLSRNSLTDEHIKLLAPVLKKCKYLEKIELRWNLIEDEGCMTLCDSLPRKVRSLNLIWNSIDVKGCNRLLEIFKSHPLKVLEIEGNDGAKGDFENRLRESRALNATLILDPSISECKEDGSDYNPDDASSGSLEREEDAGHWATAHTFDLPFDDDFDENVENKGWRMLICCAHNKV